MRKDLFASYWYNNILHIYSNELSYYIKNYVLSKYIEHKLPNPEMTLLLRQQS